jgi:hypothetical protein
VPGRFPRSRQAIPGRSRVHGAAQDRLRVHRPGTAGTGPPSPPRSTRSSTSTCRAGSGPRPAAATAEPRPRHPRSGRTAPGGIRDGQWSVRGPRQPDRASGCGWPRRGRSAASAAGPLSPETRPGRRIVPGRPGGHPHAHRKDGPAAPGERATAPARQAAKAETPGRALARPGPVWQQRDRLAARDYRAPPLRARRATAEETRRRLAAED